MESFEQMPNTIKINEIFYSIQGESLLAGKPTVFVRTSTCNLRCVWCDTKYAYWQGEVMSIESILSQVQTFSPKYVCITGGEPLGQRGTIELLQKLVLRYTTSLETSGSFSVREVPREVIKVIDIKCPESGESLNFNRENIDLVDQKDQFKFVVASKKDFDWAHELSLRERLFEKCTILFSPVYGKIRPADLAQWILDSQTEGTLQLQLHKEIWGESVKGV